MKVTLSYQPQELPPPFAYAAVMKIVIGQNMNDIQFDLSYLDRESVSEDELRAEGFTDNDDFSWKGEIGTNWNDEIRIFKQSEYNENPDPHTYLHVEIDAIPLGFPEDIKQMEILFQELFQAVLEKAQIEAPLLISCSIDHDKYDLEWNFVERTLYCNGRSINNGWEEGRLLLKQIFSFDFEAFQVKSKIGKNSINPGDGQWYDLSNSKLLEQINSFVSKNILNG